MDQAAAVTAPKPRRAYTSRKPGAAPVRVSDADDAETDIDALAAQAEGLQDDPHAATAAAAATVQRANAPEAMTVTRAELQRLIAAAVADAIGTRRQAERAPNAEAQLPDQRDIDVATITRPTLTRQGYVVPKDYGLPVALNAAQRM